MNSVELVESCPGLTYRKLDHWCRLGVFGDRKAETGSGIRRSFDDEDQRVAYVLGRVSDAFDRWSGGRGGMVMLYKEVAQQVRRNVDVAVVDLATGVSIVVDVHLDQR